MGETLRTTKAAGVEPNPHAASLFSRTHFSPLTRRIVFFNAFALLILIAGVLWVQSTGGGLVEERMAGIRDQAAIVGGAFFAVHKANVLWSGVISGVRVSRQVQKDMVQKMYF